MAWHGSDGEIGGAQDVAESPSRNGRSLVKTVGEELRRGIESGQLATGGKLPSQQLLAARFNVSRTVVREAIASLEADGLLEARQGAGVFVTQKPAAPALPFGTIDTARLSSILEILELRSGLEIEAAALAAQRRSPAQEEAIFRALHAMGALVATGERSTAADFAFHRAVAVATNNPRFAEFLDLLGPGAIPRASLSGSGEAGSFETYFARLQGEDRGIATAVAGGGEAARGGPNGAPSRGSQDRYRALIHKNPSESYDVSIGHHTTR